MGQAWRVPHSVAAPAAMIGAVIFFELAVAAAIAFCLAANRGAALAYCCRVLVEVPVMLMLVRSQTEHGNTFPVLSLRIESLIPICTVAMSLTAPTMRQGRPRRY